MKRTADASGENRWAPLLSEIDFRPIVVPACAFIAGVLLHEFLPAAVLPVALIAGALVLAFPIVYLLRGRALVLRIVLAALCLACGYLRHAYHTEVMAPDDVSRFVPAEGSALVRLRGTIVTRPRRTESRSDGLFSPRDFIRTRFDLDVDAARTRDGWQPASGTVQVNVYDRADDFTYGDRVEFLAPLSHPLGPSSDGEFDYRTYLRRHGIRVRASLSSREALGGIIEHHRGNLFMELAQGIGTRLARVVDRYHGAGEAGLLRCILLGERGAVDEKTERTFRLSGLSHLLTVSGLHVMVLLGGMWVGLRFVGVDERRIAAVAIVAAVLYASMAGMQPSVMRAAVVMVVYASGVLVARRHNMLGALAVAAVILVVRNPDELFFAGFQLSFVSVLGLVTLAPGLDRFLAPRLGLKKLDQLPGAHHWLRARLNRLFIGSLAITAAAWFAAQPLTAYHFNVLNPITLVINLLLLPAFGVILLASFVVLIVETLIGGFLVAWVSDALVALLTGLSRVASRLPGAWVNMPPPPVWWLCAYYASLVFVAMAPLVHVRRRRAALVPLVLFTGLVAAQLLPARPDAPRLVVLDVGQGSCALVRSSQGDAALIDVGTQNTSDIGKWTVIPYLVRHRVKTLDAVFLSHTDVDHISGLPRLVENFRVKKVFLGEDFHQSNAGLRVERYLIDRGVPVETVGRGDRITLGDMTLEVLHPPKDPALIRRWTPNERSAVVRGVTPAGRFLVFGDLTRRGLWDLLRREPRSLEADVAIAAHHGGVSGVEEIAADYRWPIVLFSAGEGFIRAEKRRAYESAGARTFATADVGTITVRFGDTVTVDTYRAPATHTEETR